MIGVELNYFRASHNIIWNGGTIIPSWDQAVNHYSYIGVNGKLYFPLLFLQPFVTLGYGYYTADIHNIDKANEGGFNFGAGLDLRLGRRFSLTAEGRWHKVSVSIQNIDLDLGDFTLWGGLQFHF
jgi:opacity protein-like surface antigen